MNLQQLDFGYSLKNIPIASEQKYLKCLADKIGLFIRRIRWKAYFYDQGRSNDDKKRGNFGFKSMNTPPKNEYLKPFEDELYQLLKIIEFKPVKNAFLNKLKSDMKQITKSNKVVVFADKTTNAYQVDKDEYCKLKRENISKNYKKAKPCVMNGINREAKDIVNDLNLSGKVMRYAEKHCFITFKDHKPNFERKVQCRLINPAKSEVGKVSSSILQEINECVRQKSELCQWRDTKSVINWFCNVKKKEKRKFLKFDIKDFYPSIHKKLLMKSIKFAQEYTDIDDTTINIIMHARKSLLFDESGPWIKKDDDALFDVTQGSYDGAEVCELVGLFMLSLLTKKFGKDCVGLYRDDGLAVLPQSGPMAERARKDIIAIFDSEDLQITVETNLTKTDFLDVNFDLKNDKYYPYRKVNNNPLYINAKSNHPPAVLKQIPVMIADRLSCNSSNQHEFHKAKSAYEKALEESGFEQKLLYNQNGNKKRRKRSRNVIFFNPPYNASVKNNVGNLFLRMVLKHFPAGHKYRSLFNRNNLKLSYSCMPNIANIIQAHNSKMLKGEEVKPKSCNCRKKSNCPLDGRCQEKCIVYKAEVDNNKESKVYYGMCEDTFKLRFNNHQKSFRNQKYENETALSKYVWKNRDRDEEVKIKWSIEKKAFPFQCGAKRCDLCVSEALCIARADGKTLLNSRNELISKCPHRRKFTFFKPKKKSKKSYKKKIKVKCGKISKGNSRGSK